MDIEAAGVKGACVSRTKVPPRGGGGEGDGEYWLVQGGFDSASSGGTGVRFPLAGGGGSGKGVPKATVGLMVICMVASLMGGRSFCVKRSIGGRNGEWWAVSCCLEGSPARDGGIEARVSPYCSRVTTCEGAACSAGMASAGVTG